MPVIVVRLGGNAAHSQGKPGWCAPKPDIAPSRHNTAAGTCRAGSDTGQSHPRTSLKALVVRQLEGPPQVRLQFVGLPQAVHLALRNTAMARHAATAPATSARRRLNHLADHPLHPIRRQLRRTPRARRFLQPPNPLFGVPLPPEFHRVPVDPQSLGNALVAGPSEAAKTIRTAR